MVADSEEEMVRTTTAAEDLLGNQGRSVNENRGVYAVVTRSGLGSRQSSRIKSSATRKHGMRTRLGSNQLSGYSGGNPGQAGEEAIKVLEIGRAIGFDFSGEEEEVLEVVKRREEEDQMRYEAMSS